MRTKAMVVVVSLALVLGITLGQGALAAQLNQQTDSGSED
jgi:hypothetical protein